MDVCMKKEMFRFIVLHCFDLVPMYIHMYCTGTVPLSKQPHANDGVDKEEE